MTKRKLPSDPEFLLKFMDDIDSDGSDDDFDENMQQQMASLKLLMLYLPV